MPVPSGCDIWIPSVKSQVRVPGARSPFRVGLVSILYINVWRCGGLSMVLLQLLDSFHYIFIYKGLATPFLRVPQTYKESFLYMQTTQKA